MDTDAPSLPATTPWRGLFRRVLRGFALSLVRLFYDVRALNIENVPEEGGVLMVSNHVTYVDAFMISAACPRPVRFVIESHYLRFRALGWFPRLFDAVPISTNRAKEAIRTTAEAVNEGSIVCIFAEGRLTRTGMLNELQKGFELIARQARCDVLPVYMDSLWGSIFSFERFRYFYKVPKHFPYPVTVNFGATIPPREATGERVRAVIQDLSAEAFAERNDLRCTLGDSILRSFHRWRRDELFVDLGRERRALQHKQAGAAALALARKWTAAWPVDQEGCRIGILLPAGSMAALMHVALVLAHRVPVSLPLSLLVMDPAERDGLLERHGIGSVISSRALLGDHPWPESWIDMRETVTSIRLGEKLAARVILRLQSARRLVSRFHGNMESRETEAVAYLTEEDLELVSLSHFNLLASVCQIDSSLIVLPNDRILSQSAFTSPAAQVLALWYPLLKRATAIYRGPSARKLALPLILADQRPQIVLLDETLREEVSRASGAACGTAPVRIWLDFHPQRLPDDVVEALEKPGATYCLGLAPPRLGAILIMNTNDPHSMVPAHLPQTGNRPGTVGRLLPGISARLLTGDASTTLWQDGDLIVSGSSLPRQNHGLTLEREGHTWVRTRIHGKFDREGFFTVTAPAPNGPLEEKEARHGNR